MNTLEMKLKCAVKAINSKKAENIEIINVGSVSCFFDYFVVCEATNTRQLKAIVDAVDEFAEKEGFECKVNGTEESGWMICDFNDIAIHVFDVPTRDYYQLERLYNDLERLDWSVFDNDK